VIDVVSFPVYIVVLGEIGPVVGAAALEPAQSRVRDEPRDRYQVELFPRIPIVRPRVGEGGPAMAPA